MGSTAEPGALAHAKLILALCDKFHCLPSAVLDEDAEILQLLRIVELGGGDRDGEHGQYPDYDY